MIMKNKRRILDAMQVVFWAFMCMLSLVLLLMTERSAYGFCSIFCLIWFLSEDYDYKKKYPDQE